MRLYYYPLYILKSAWQDTTFPSLLDRENPPPVAILQACRVLLTILLVMHVYWFALFCRLAVRLMTQSAHDAGRDEYEGQSTASETEHEATDDEDKKRT
jgi:hypothetical protein